MKIKVILAVSILILVLFCGCINNQNPYVPNTPNEPNEPNNPSNPDSILYERYNGDYNNAPSISSPAAQTFPVNTAHYITGVRLHLSRYGTPGIFTVSIRATDSLGRPTGGNLISVTSDGNTLPTGAFEWRMIEFTSPYLLTQNTKYAIVVEVTGSTVRWAWILADAYGGGGFYEFIASSWSYQGGDLLFEEYGFPE